MNTLPSITKSEWGDLLQGKITPRLSSLSLQLKLNALKNSLKSGKSDLPAAISSLHTYCSANVKMYESDLKTIFNLS
jgi:hypothetical protein